LGRHDGRGNRHHAGTGKPRQHPAGYASVGPEKLQSGHAGIINQAAILATMRSLFHLAFHVTNLEVARQFYGSLLGCTEGRSTATWVDFDFFGHQLSLHLGEPFKTTRTGQVGEHLVPMPHFGVVLVLPDWQALAQRLSDAGVEFVLPPHVRFEGEPGEQWTLFVLDPFGNPIEAKGFRSLDTVYAAP
jgi:extradiol dioxygenase family protein